MSVGATEAAAEAAAAAAVAASDAKGLTRDRFEWRPLEGALRAPPPAPARGLPGYRGLEGALLPPPAPVRRQPICRRCTYTVGAQR